MTLCTHCFIDSATVAMQSARINELEQTNADLIDRLKNEMGEGLIPYGTRGLTPQQVRMLSILLVQERVSNATLFEVAQSDAEDADKLVKVQMHKLKRKLGALGLEVETIWGFGYRIPRENREATLEKLAVAQQV